MTLISRPLAVGSLRGTVYTFETVGDELPVHAHTSADNHITVLAYGRVSLKGHPAIDGKSVEAKPGGTILRWDDGEMHGIVAETDGATIVNILVNT